MIFFLFSFLLISSTRAADTGILLLAHGGNAEWNKDVQTIADKVGAETALGMADVATMQAAVDRLEKKGVKKIVAVPLFIHSRSEVLDQTRYALGLSTQPSYVLRDALAAMGPHAHHHGMGFSLDKVKLKEPVVLTKALDDSPILTDLLARRAAALSKSAASETVLLVGHGPVDEKANDEWLTTMRLHAARLKEKGNYKTVTALTIRDDSPKAVKEPALAALRRAVEQARQEGGRAVVIPYLIARGGIEDHITEALKGLDYAWDGKTILPDDAVISLIKERANP